MNQPRTPRSWDYGASAIKLAQAGASLVMIESGIQRSGNDNFSYSIQWFSGKRKNVN